MEPKEIIKKRLQEKLDSKSREELIDIIVDMSSVCLIAKHSGFLDSLVKSAMENLNLTMESVSG